MPDEIMLEMVKKFFTDHKEDADVVAYLKEIAPKPDITPELLSGYLQTQEGKNLVQPMIDQKVTEAIKTHDEKNKAKIEAAIRSGIAAEMLKLNPEESPEMKRIRELEERDARREAEMQQAKVDSEILQVANQLKVDTRFLGPWKFPTVEDGKLYLQNLKKEIDTARQAAQEDLISKGYKPQNPGNGDNGQKKMTISQFRALPENERVALVEKGFSTADLITG